LDFVEAGKNKKTNKTQKEKFRDGPNAKRKEMLPVFLAGFYRLRIPRTSKDMRKTNKGCRLKGQLNLSDIVNAFEYSLK